MASSPHATTSEKMSRGTCRSDRVRSLVLEAGAKLFSQRGFAGTSFRNLSAESGISVGLIQYHFGTKEKLYEAVREHVFSEYLRAQRPQFDLPQEEFDLFIRGGLAGYFRFLDSHPEWMRLMEWGILEGNGAPWPGEEELMDALAGRGRAREGVFRPLLPASLVRRASARGNGACGISRKHGRILSVEE